MRLVIRHDSALATGFEVRLNGATGRFLQGFTLTTTPLAGFRAAPICNLSGIDHFRVGWGLLALWQGEVR
jgi:hypothetical protein